MEGGRQAGREIICLFYQELQPAQPVALELTPRVRIIVIY
jgi:hypothetical protein